MVPDIPKDVILTASGTRGIVGDRDGLTPSFILNLTMAYGTWLKRMQPDRPPAVIVGRDTRPSGPMIEAGVVNALLSTGCDVHVAGVCPTPAVVHAKQRLAMEGAVIISASHNPAEYNGLKFLSPAPPGTFLSNEELEPIKQILLEGQFRLASWKEPRAVKEADIITPYLRAISSFIKPLLAKKPHVKVIVDTGAGAGKHATTPLLKMLGCDVKPINDEMASTPPFFPRSSEPIAENLQMLSEMVPKYAADIGFGIDCDADRISLCDEKGRILREDEGLALIMRDMLGLYDSNRKLVIVTNVASSLMFDDIAREKGGEVIRTPIGERYLAVQMHELAKKQNGKIRLAIVGGEGSCGGIMMPELNLARDATLAAACVVAIMTKRDLPLSALAKELPEYHLEKVKIPTTGHDPLAVMESVAKKHEPSSFTRIMNDIKFAGDGWWALIHPSNTEPIIRVLVEAKTQNRAASLLATYQDEVTSAMSKR
jgi:phosphoglucosamine mutase